MKTWTKPTLKNLSNTAVQSGNPTAPYAFEHYINLGSYGTQTGNGGGPWPCITTGGVFVTSSFYNASNAVACNSIAACDQAGGATGPANGLSATANCS